MLFNLLDDYSIDIAPADIPAQFLSNTESSITTIFNSPVFAKYIAPTPNYT